METRLSDSFGTWRTFLRTRIGVICISSKPATEAKEPLATAIFRLLGHGVYMWKNWDIGVIWSVAPESIIHELAGKFSEAFIQKGIDGLPERAKEQAPEDFSRDPKRFFSFLISSLLNPPVAEFSPGWGCSVAEFFPGWGCSARCA